MMWTREKIEQAYQNVGRDFSGEDFSVLDLRGVILTGADLTGANLTGANLTWADLTVANLTGADLTGADLTGANLTGAYMGGARMTKARMTGADLTGAIIDYSCWPLWCGSLDVKVDKRIAVQLMYHACALNCDDPEYQEARAKVLDFANQMHRTDVERLE